MRLEFLKTESDERASRLLQRLMQTAPVLCGALIDQGRTMGGDPVGHACDQPARVFVTSGGLRWAVCERCLEWLTAENGRVTLPWFLAIMETPS